jgi:hypothetical protein
MITFLRKIRYTLIGTNNTKYFKYAIGEIILVVLGILIALQINIWNEDRKDKIALDNIFETIQNDLYNDIEEGKAIVLKFKKNAPYYVKMFGGTITREEFNECNCDYVFISFQDLYINTRGYELLKQTNNQLIENSSVTEKTLNFYNNYLTKFRLVELTLNNYLYETTNKWSNHNWWSDFRLGINNKGYRDFIINNNMNFRNDVASFSFAINNIYVPRIIKFIN